MKDSSPEWLAKEVSSVLQGVLIHQRPRWGTLLGHERQFEGWWKAELATALESWTWRADLQAHPFAVRVEAKPRDFNLVEEADRRSVDLLVAPWSDSDWDFVPKGKPRAWIELKTRATWWGPASKALGTANSGLYSDLEKWRRFGESGDIVIVCHIAAHDGPWEERLPKDWEDALGEVSRRYEGSPEPLTIGFEVPGDKGRNFYRWTRMDCFVLRSS